MDLKLDLVYHMFSEKNSKSNRICE